MRRYLVPPFPPFRILVYLRNAPSALPFLYIIMYMCIVRQPRHKKVRSGGSIYGLYKRRSKMPTNPTKGESEAKATSLKGYDRRLLLDVYISKSEQSHFVCSCVHNLEVQVFSGTIAPQNAHLFLQTSKRAQKCFCSFFFFFFLGQTSATLRLYSSGNARRSTYCRRRVKY